MSAQRQVGDEEITPAERRWADALTAAALLAIGPEKLGGITLRAAPGPIRDVFLQNLYEHWPGVSAPVKAPAAISADGLLGGLDLSATLAEGRPISSAGVLERAHGEVLQVSMAERLSSGPAAVIAAALDNRVVPIERDGTSRRAQSSFACILLDEGEAPDEMAPFILVDRLAFFIDLNGLSVHDIKVPGLSAGVISAARTRFVDTKIDDASLAMIDQTALSVGVPSIRALSFCAAAARASAALAGESEVREKDVETACRLVLGPRAVPIPPRDDEHAPPPPETRDTDDKETDDDVVRDPEDFQDVLIAAAQSALHGGVFETRVRQMRRRAGAGGKSGARVMSLQKGRPVGSSRGDPRDGGRLDLMATILAAAPWRKIRSTGRTAKTLPIYPQDFRVQRLQGRSESVVIFVVDASGSAALHRMEEAKGAVEYLLSDCYTRRDYVALIAFRGTGADLVLAPTRSLLRVRRVLEALPAGGGTPFASGLQAALQLVTAERRRGREPYVVVLSDGQSNIALNGQPGREAAQEDALMASRLLAREGCNTIFFDTAPRANPRAARLAREMHAVYRPLPYSDAAFVSREIQEAIRTA